MYTTTIRGFKVQCDTLEELMRLLSKCAPGEDVADGAPKASQKGKEDPWPARAQQALELMASSGTIGVEVNNLAKQIGLKGARGIGPLNKRLQAIMDSNGGDAAGFTVHRRRASDKKKYWFLSPKALNHVLALRGQK